MDDFPLKKTMKVVALHDSRIVEVLGFKGKGRPGKDCKPAIIGYRIEAGVASVLETRLQGFGADISLSKPSP